MPLTEIRHLFATYVTAKVPIQVLEDLVRSSAKEWLSAPDMKSPYLLSIFRNKAEVAQEKERVQGLTTLSGTEAPISETETYDFLGANLYDLATCTLEAFPDGSFASNEYILVVDERSIEDRTCILVKIPKQVELDENRNVVRKERAFYRRSQYYVNPDGSDQGWIDDDGRWTREKELEVVRVTFEEANLANMLDDKVEVMLTLAGETYQTNGVYKEGARYPLTSYDELEGRQILSQYKVPV